MRKKIRKNLMISALVATMAVSLIGCSPSYGFGGLIHESKEGSTQQDDISQTLKNLLPDGADYVTAKNSNEKQGIIFADINQDEQKEALVLYQNENKEVHFIALQEDQDGYHELWDYKTGFLSIDYFDVVDLDGDGKKEIVSGGELPGQQSLDQLIIYGLEENELKEKEKISYEKVLIQTFQDNSNPSLFILTKESSEELTANRYSYEQGNLKLCSSVALYPQAVPENMTVGHLADGVDAVFIDSGIGAHSMLTEIFTVKDGMLTKIGKEEDGVLMKEYPLYSRDINDDGIIEVGGLYIPNGYEDAAMAEIPFIHTYNDYKLDGSKEIIEERYEDEEHKFYITIPADLYELVTVKKIDQGVQLVSVSGGEILIEVKWKKKDGADPKDSLGEMGDTVFYTDFNGNMPISADQFHFME